MRRAWADRSPSPSQQAYWPGTEGWVGIREGRLCRPLTHDKTSFVGAMLIKQALNLRYGRPQETGIGRFVGICRDPRPIGLGRTPAGLARPGTGEEMEGVVQQAAHPGRQVKVIRSKAFGSAWPQGPHLQGLLETASQFARCGAGARVIVGPHGAHDGGAGVLGQHQAIKRRLGSGGLHPHRGAVGDAAAVHRDRALGGERHALCTFGAGRHAALGHGFFAEEHHTRVLPQQLGWSKGESIDTSTIGT